MHAGSLWSAFSGTIPVLGGKQDGQKKLYCDNLQKRAQSHKMSAGTESALQSFVTLVNSTCSCWDVNYEVGGYTILGKPVSFSRESCNSRTQM